MYVCMYVPTSLVINSRNSQVVLIKNPWEGNILSGGLHSRGGYPKVCRKLSMFQLALEVMLINTVNVKNGLLLMKLVACCLLC